MGADLEAQIGTARKMFGRARKTGEGKKRWRPIFLRREHEPARGDKIIRFCRPELADDDGGRLAFQRLFHGPKGLFRALGRDENKAGGIEAVEREARPIERALFAGGKILADPDDRGLRFVRTRRKTGGQRQEKAGSRSRIAGACPENFRERPELQPAGEQAIEPAVAAEGDTQL